MTEMDIVANRLVEPRISVLLICYNQEEYIKLAAESILAQDMPANEIEIIVADDYSSDATLDIAKRVLAEFPGLPVRVLCAPENLGIVRNYQRAILACRGQYIAILEGDDYWCFPGKLSAQMQFLDSHLECNACGTNYFMFDQSKADFIRRHPREHGHSLYSAREIIRHNEVSNFSAMMYRRTVAQALPFDAFVVPAYDWIINILVARSGLVGLLYQPMSVYRIHAKATWSGQRRHDQLKLLISLIPTYDKISGGLFHDEFEHILIDSEREMQSNDKLPRNPSKNLVILLRSCIPPIVRNLIILFLPPVLLTFLIKLLRRRR